MHTCTEHGHVLNVQTLAEYWQANVHNACIAPSIAGTPPAPTATALFALDWSALIAAVAAAAAVDACGVDNDLNPNPLMTHAPLCTNAPVTADADAEAPLAMAPATVRGRPT